MSHSLALQDPAKARFPAMLFFSMLGHFVGIILMIFAPDIFPGGNPEPFGGPGGEGGLNVTWVNFGEGQAGKPAAEKKTQEEPAPPRYIRATPEPEQVELKSKTELPDPTMKPKKKDEPTEKATLNVPKRKVEGPFGKGEDTKKNAGVTGNQGAGKSGIGTVGSGGGPGGFGTGTGVPFPFPWYIESVMTKLELSWIKPYIQDPSGRSYSAVVYFVITRNGEVRSVKLEQPSGVHGLDRSVESAVFGASPFPPLPGAWREPELAFRIQFTHTPQE